MEENERARATTLWDWLKGYYGYGQVAIGPNVMNEWATNQKVKVSLLLEMGYCTLMDNGWYIINEHPKH